MDKVSSLECLKYVASLECLKLDSELEVLDKDDSGKDIFSTAMVPLNCDTPIIGSKPEESRHEESEDEESEDEESETKESEDEESQTEESEDEESETEESHTEESEDEESQIEESEDEEIGSKTKEYESGDSEDEEVIEEKLRIAIGECKYCLHVGEHISQLCPSQCDAPKNATLGEGCMVVCSICCCLLRDSCCADCDPSIGCAVLKDCPICGKQGEHWPSTCSKRKRKHIPFASTCYSRVTAKG